MPPTEVISLFNDSKNGHQLTFLYIFLSHCHLDAKGISEVVKRYCCNEALHEKLTKQKNRDHEFIIDNELGQTGNHLLIAKEKPVDEPPFQARIPRIKSLTDERNVARLLKRLEISGLVNVVSTKDVNFPDKELSQKLCRHFGLEITDSLVLVRPQTEKTSSYLRKLSKERGRKGPRKLYIPDFNILMGLLVEMINNSSGIHKTYAVRQTTSPLEGQPFPNFVLGGERVKLSTFTTEMFNDPFVFLKGLEIFFGEKKYNFLTILLLHKYYLGIKVDALSEKSSDIDVRFAVGMQEMFKDAIIAYATL